jgi:hypothetical protein
VAGGEPSAWMERLTQWAYHEWAIDWRPMEEVEGKEEFKHCSQVKLQHSMTLFGKLNILNLKVSSIFKILNLYLLRENTTESSKILSLHKSNPSFTNFPFLNQTKTIISS